MLTLLAAVSFAADPAPGALPIVPDARFALALYCNPTCGEEVLDALDTALAPIPATDEFSEHAPEPARIMGIAGEEFGIPDPDFVDEFGEGVQDPAALSASKEVVLAWFAGPREQAFETFATAHAAFASVAASTGGWVEDLDTQMLFGADAWAARDPRGSVQSWFVVDREPMSEDDEVRLRLVTRGLRRYGDFDLVVEDVAPDAAGDVAWALDAIAETLHPLPEVAPEVTVNTDTARGVAKLSVATPREDDPQDGLLRVRFAGEVTVDDGPLVAAEAPVPAQPDVPVAAPARPDGAQPLTPGAPAPETLRPPLAGPASVPAVVPAPSTGPAPRSLAEARAQVRASLVTYEAAWAAGLPGGDHFAISAPFTTGTGGQEYLWIEVARWSGGELSGPLVTAPNGVVGLQPGDEVVVREDDVYDYVYKHADGRKDGNLTRPFR